MPRVNVTTWSDGCTITRMMAQLQDALMKYQPYAIADQLTGEYGRGCLGGDQTVMIAAIELRNRLAALIDRSARANNVSA